MEFSLILTSPVRRAYQTAQIVSNAQGAEMLIAPWLACGMHPQGALEELRAHRNQNSVLLVGHEPDFSQFIAHLLGMPTNNAIHVRKASLTLLDLEIFRAGAATLQFSIPCKLM